MRSGSSLHAPAPSSSLLRFLRYQSEALYFFTPSKTTASQTSRAGRTCTAKFSISSPRYRATVESSLLSHGILRPTSKHRTSPFTTLHPDGRTSLSSILPSEASKNIRRASTDTRPLLKKLWKQKERRETTNLKPADLPPLPSFLDEVGGTNLGRKKPGKAVNELKLRCTEFDNEGKVTLMDGEFKKTELIAKVQDFLRIGILSH